ncbi:hypothetical protein COLO4_19453 [Corchorus olitorius]|uniref:Uncharacterized protein n=1 Tax=Corchorus olitorius TaxID=93759 RepID=A0A1R3J579_9ROSI|nr:hypothetical protein COLO4_19453 [Corchorus olitorius]
MSSSDEEMSTRKKNRQEEEQAGDRISSLGDEILHKIMSFMNTKYAVQTCVLSKRWKYLWKSLPYLDFELQTFPFKGSTYEEAVISLINFITQVLFRRHRTDLVKVSFQSYNVPEPYAFIPQGLIAYAVDHNVQQLAINCGYHRLFVMPKSFYSCKSLTTLQVLNNLRLRIELPKFLALPALKSLHLRGVSVTKKGFNTEDFSACPNLETLRLEVFFEEHNTLFINGPKLKRLELSLRGPYGKFGLKVVIDAPKLKTFHYDAIDPIVCSFGDLASIDDVNFSMYNCYPLGYEGDGEDEDYFDMPFDMYREYVLHCVDTFKKFHQAKSLTLPWRTVEAWKFSFPSTSFTFGLAKEHAEE